MNLNKLLALIPALIYIVFLLGIAALEMDNIITLTGRLRLRHRLSARPEEGSLSKRCTELLLAAFGKRIDGMWLLIGSGVIFAAMFIVAIRSFNAAMSLIIASLCTALPYAALFARVTKQRSLGSREGLALVTELFRQYRMHELNMQEAIEAALIAKSEFPICKKQLYVLLLRMRDAGSVKDVKECCRQFAYALGTVWGRMLSVCIELSCTRGVDVSAGLSDIIEQLKTAKALAEERKRLNGEAARMTLFLVPLLYAASLFMSVRYLGISLDKFIHNQFLTAEGLLFLLVNIVLFMVNLIIISIINAKRMDY